MDQHLAHSIIQQLGQSGQPPEYGVQYFTVGLNAYLHVLEHEYLSTFVKEGGSAFKLVVGAYGGGKTHFLYSVRNLSWNSAYAVSYVSLKSGGECPFDKLDLVYKAIVNGLLPPITGPDVRIDDVQGIENFLNYWYSERFRNYTNQGKSNDAARQAIAGDIDSISAANIHSISFRNAIVHALRAILNNQEQTFSEICQWLKGERPPSKTLQRLSINQKVDRTTAFSLIRSLAGVMRSLDYSGMVVLLDEAEIVPSLSRGQRDQLLSNLREFIDECGKSWFKGMMVFYAVPDQGFLDGQTQVYEALRQRLATAFELFNPTGVRIDLDESVNDPVVFLTEVGDKIVPIYNLAQQIALDPSDTKPLIARLAQEAYSQRFADSGYKRLFVQGLVTELNRLHYQRSQPAA